MILLTIIFAVGAQDKLLGCYKDVAQLKKVSFENYYPKKDCVNECNRKYYRLVMLDLIFFLLLTNIFLNTNKYLFFRYAFIKEPVCSCGNYLSEQVVNVTCDDCTICGDFSDLQDVFFTGNLGKT